MSAILRLSSLHYGSTIIRVQRTVHLPLPEVFDFQNPIDCAKKAMAIMSNASGGFMIQGVKLRIHERHESANLTGNGAHVFWSAGHKLALEDAIKMHEESTLFELGTVSSDQYGGGWKRAVWR